MLRSRMFGIAAVRGQNVGVAQVEYSCEPIVPGDFAVPFVEKPAVTLPHTIMFDRFAAPNGKTTGQIVLAKDFDQYLATGKKAYINIGTDKGLKVGDYLRAVRTYEDARKNEVDTLSYKASTTEDTQKNPHSFPVDTLERTSAPHLGRNGSFGRVSPHFHRHDRNLDR